MCTRTVQGLCNRLATLIIFVVSHKLTLILVSTVASPAFVRTSEMKMVPMETVTNLANSVVAQNANLLATSADDFAGYRFPIFGIACLAAVILFFSPPLADE